jgi:hypothetical protein
MIELEKIMDETLNIICAYENEDDKKYFKDDYFRIKSIYDKEAANWIAII